MALLAIRSLVVENNHGTNDDRADFSGAGDSDGKVCVVKGRQLVRVDRQFATSLVLSVGTAVALIIYTVQVCKHPDMAVALSAAILAPIVQLAIKLSQRKCPACKARKEDEAQ